jgi:hypothetical protein
MPDLEFGENAHIAESSSNSNGEAPPLLPRAYRDDEDISDRDDEDSPELD